MNKLHLMGVLSATLIFSGCATIVGGGNAQEVAFTSYPEGAKVKVDGREVCKATPCKVSIERKQSAAVVIVEKDGYQAVTREISSTINPWVIGNIILGGPIGTTTDAISGSTFKYEADALHVELRQK